MVEKRHLIVGIDPGTTTGVALLGLDGSVLGIYSSRTLNLKDLIHLIIGHGYPLVVATDVTPVPAFVDKVCHLFEAVLHEPPHSLTIEEKREIARSHSERFSIDLAFRNSHEKDAFAAAAKALESYGEKFRWIDRKLSERDMGNVSEQVKAMVISGRSLSDSLSEVLKAREPAKKRAEALPSKAVRATRDEAKLSRSRRIERSMIRNMEEEILELKTKLKERELKIKSLGHELEGAHSEGFWKILRSRELDSRNKMILELKRSLSRVAADRNRLRREIASMSGSGLWKVADRIETIKVVADLSKRTVGDLARSAEEGRTRLVYVRDCSGMGSKIAEKLGDIGIEAVIAGGEIPAPARERLESSGVPIITPKALDIIVLEEVALAEGRALDRALSRERKRLARRVAQAATEQLKRYVDDYRRKVTSQK